MSLSRLASTRFTGVSQLLLVGLGLALLGSVANSQELRTSVQLAVIVHPATIEDEISLEALRRIFLGEQQFWQDRSRVTLLMHPTGAPEREAVLRQIYRMSETEIKRYWIAKLFRAEAMAGPKIVQGNEAMIRLVAAIPGSIAVVPAATVPAQVKVLRVNDMLPGAPGYPLRTLERR